MIKNVAHSSLSAAAEHLRDAQAILDRIPGLTAASARLSHVVEEVEDVAADAILAGRADEGDESAPCSQ